MKCYLLLFVFSLSSSLFQDDEAGQKADLETRLETATGTQKVDILNELVLLYASSDLDHADSLSNETSKLLQDLDYPEGQILNLNNIAYIKGSLGNYEEAFQSARASIELSGEIGSDLLLAKSYDMLFTVHFLKGENTEATIAAEKANELAREAGDSSLMAKSYDNLGILNGIKGRHSTAIEYFMKSLKAYERLGNDSKTGLALMHLGHTFELAGNYGKALEYLQKSLEINQKTGNRYNEGWTLVNIGVVYSRLNKLDTALSYYERSLVIGEEINNQRLILTNLDNIGGKYSLMKDFDKANYYLQKAYKLSEASGQNSRTVYISGNLAENYLYMGQFDSARIFGEKQLDIALASELISEQKVAYYILAQIYDSLGQYERSKNALLNYITVNDTIFNRQKSEQIESLRETFEADRKEQEIANLAKEKQSAEFRRNIYGLIAILIFIIGAFVYNQQRIRNQRRKILLEKEIEIDRMKSRFFSNISHEFRTPLTLILGPINELLSKIDQVDVKRQLRVIQRNASRLLDLVNQLLDLSKIESGKFELHCSRSDIIPIIKGVAMSFHSIAEQKNITLELDTHPDKLEMNYDRAKVETILTNLLSNAFKFTPDYGLITIQSGLDRIQENGEVRESLRISVIDTGIGISEADVSQIFDRFYQSETNHLHHNDGSGIGLALTRELVELHEGKIIAESKINQGTRIDVLLPMDIPIRESLITEHMESDFVIPEYIASNLPIINTDIQPEHPEKSVILVIEDHVDVREYIREILEPKFMIITASDGEEGISKALDCIPDLIISDVMMPKKNGFEVCGILKQDERTSHIPTILLTAKSDSEDKIAGLKTKADDYITKPFVPRELIVRIENLIALRARLREKYKKEGILKPKEITVNSVDENFLNKLAKIVEENMGDEKFGVERLGEKLNLSRSQLHRKLTALLGLGPNQFIRSFRLQRAHDLLKQKSATASEIAYQVGFSSPSYFTKCFHEQFGYTPTDILA